jgi:hypothetical protein
VRDDVRDAVRDDGAVAVGGGDGVRDEGAVAVGGGDGVRDEGAVAVGGRDGVRDEGAVAVGGGDGSPDDVGDDVRDDGEDPGDRAELSPEGRGVASGGGDEPGDGPLLGAAAELRQRWEAVQVGFVDDPRRAVEAAAGMVSEAAAALQAEIERRRGDLVGSRDAEAEHSTDALLAAFHDYRALFDRVVSA